jgi:hypothetical protein
MLEGVDVNMACGVVCSPELITLRGVASRSPIMVCTTDLEWVSAMINVKQCYNFCSRALPII